MAVTTIVIHIVIIKISLFHFPTMFEVPKFRKPNSFPLHWVFPSTFATIKCLFVSLCISHSLAPLLALAWGSSGSACMQVQSCWPNTKKLPLCYPSLPHLFSSPLLPTPPLTPANCSQLLSVFVLPAPKLAARAAPQVQSVNED